MNLFNNRIELYWRDGSWCRPDEWVFSYYRMKCASYEATGHGCLIIQLGWIGIEINQKICQYLTDKRLEKAIKEIEEQER